MLNSTGQNVYDEGVAILMVQISISPKFIRKVALVLCSLVFGLAALSWIFDVLNLVSQAVGGGMELTLFALNGEQNVPTWYSSSMRLICAILLAVIAIAAGESEYRRHWMGLSAIFLYLSVDELASIHEKVGSILEERFDTGGFLTYAWVIPYAFLVLVFVLLYTRFLYNLPANTRLLFFAAGTLFVGGALGVEMVNGRTDDLYGGEHLAYLLGSYIEEVFEMLGELTFFYALLSYIGLHVKEVEL